MGLHTFGIVHHDTKLLINHRYGLEVLTELTEGAMSLPELRAGLQQPRRLIRGALRSLVIAGLVQTDHVGSWDQFSGRTVPPEVGYRLTQRGEALVRLLSSFAVWESF